MRAPGWSPRAPDLCRRGASLAAMRSGAAIENGLCRVADTATAARGSKPILKLLVLVGVEVADKPTGPDLGLRGRS